MQINNVSDMSNLLDSLKKQVGKAEDAADDAEGKANSSSKNEGKTRSALTISFLVGFFVLIALSGLFVLWYNNSVVSWVINLQQAGVSDASTYLKPLELEKVLSVIIGALGTSLGFIIGYYFKEKNK
ncbi:TPA: hypothetical protein L1N02_004419 [Escherichia coli]|uniref:hypothetical protein n=1 Tax=Escherichia coli TaxID=562 RepID=UPI0004D5991E|nr:hypothetical protein [Escherichia coli]KDW04007.1 hypothetical protein AB85_1449 [Escherichia coli 2-156-04_S3_C1]HBN0461245.1 hypothetical protein [Escherichia coli]HBN0501915.1 hypothetical protein [Escherichia coli]HBN0672307.1 hypothetical protein [Escherichia coli]HCC6500397.1 hypothetical protein [Escherichia coli]